MYTYCLVPVPHRSHTGQALTRGVLCLGSYTGHSQVSPTALTGLPAVKQWWHRLASQSHASMQRRPVCPASPVWSLLGVPVLCGRQCELDGVVREVGGGRGVAPTTSARRTAPLACAAAHIWLWCGDLWCGDLWCFSLFPLPAGRLTIHSPARQPPVNNETDRLQLPWGWPPGWLGEVEAGEMCRLPLVSRACGAGPQSWVTARHARRAPAAAGLLSPSLQQ